ncbi:hypothetical protein V6N11_000668 [Hibiscus sabdariffa]|uniref:Phospholipase A1 n=1 Tax=Hibiscus sabdariffa TaxID=183260 RepID=A0ABR2RXV0_9ROSI
MGSSISTPWRKLSGEKNWEGLLQPLDHDLRKYLIHYAQMTGAVGDLFNSETDEPDATKEDFFSKACLVKGNPYEYEVTRFIYAGTDFVEPSWFAYVVVATDEGKRALGRRDVLVAWRGTSAIKEWLNDFNFIIQRNASDIFPTAKQHDANVHRGFHDLYTGTRPDSPRTKTSAREQVLDAVKELVNKYEDEELSITVTGFSLGAALATLTAMDIVANGYNKPTAGRHPDKSFMVTAITFGGPRVGNIGLANLFDSLRDHLHLLRVKNNSDSVPTLPPDWLHLPYTDFGIKLNVDTYNSNYLKWKGPFGSYAAFPYKHEDELNGDECEPNRKRSRRGIDSLDEVEPKIKPVTRGFITGLYSCHNMDVYAHGVAIKDIGEKTPVEKLDHDLALVNKYLDRVSDEYSIPSDWWAGDNRKRLVQLDNGRWKAPITSWPEFGVFLAESCVRVSDLEYILARVWCFPS